MPASRFTSSRFVRGGFTEPKFARNGPSYTPASMVFNGTDEVMVRTLSTSGASTTIFTYSFWLKTVTFDGTTPNRGLALQQVINAPTNSQFLAISVTNDGDRMNMLQDFGSVDWSEFASGLTPDIAVGTWEHWVFQYDSTQGTADNRIRMYRNGTLVTDTDGTAAAPALNEAHIMFQNGFQHQIGAQLDISAFANVKMAFIEVLDGVSQAASAFGFDNGGTWTRQRYTGSYGTHGFFLDGSTGIVGADLSGNGQTFTGTNMDATNLDTADLPPYTN